MTTIRRISEDMHRQLSGQYPEAEIESFIRILFRHYLGMTPAQTHLLRDNELPAEAGRRILTAVCELKKYRPIQYILGETEFYGLTFGLTPDVLIPRPETEELVDWIVREYNRNAALSIVDIGTGSGCIAVALAARFPNARVWAVDVSGAALDVALRNAQKNSVNINFLLDDVLTGSLMGFEPGSLDVVVSNPPYIEPSEKQRMQPNVLNYEPHTALFTPADDPLIFYGRIAAFGSKCLKRRGKIFFEINELYPRDVEDVLMRNGFGNVILRKDINEKWRMAGAELS